MANKLGARIAKLQKLRNAVNPNAGEREYWRWENAFIRGPIMDEYTRAVCDLVKRHTSGEEHDRELELIRATYKAGKAAELALLSAAARDYGHRREKSSAKFYRRHPLPTSEELQAALEKNMHRGGYGRNLQEPGVEPEPVIPAPPEPLQDEPPREAIDTAPVTPKRRMASPDHLREYGGAGRLEPTEEQLAEILEFDLPGH
jgi:hypothetical protein